MSSFIQKNLKALSLTNLIGILIYFPIQNLKYGDNQYYSFLLFGALVLLLPFLISALFGAFFPDKSLIALYAVATFFIVVPILSVFFFDREVIYFSITGIGLLLFTRWNHNQKDRPLLVINILGAAVWMLLLAALLQA